MDIRVGVLLHKSRRSTVVIGYICCASKACFERGGALHCLWVLT